MRNVGRWSTRSAVLLSVLVVSSLVVLVLSGCGGPSATTPGGSGGSSNGGGQAHESAGPALPEAPAPEVSSYSFSPVSFSEPASKYQSKWNLRVKSSTVSLSNGGLRTVVVGGPDLGKGEYGGVKAPVSAPKALKLQITFTKPDAIRAFYVDGYPTGGKGKPLVRWQWRNTKGKKIPAGQDTYVLVPGKDSAYFEAGNGSDMSGVGQVDVFAMVRPGLTADFTVDKIEVGK